MWVILATACLSVVTRCQWICPSSLLHQLSHNCRVCLHCCAATSDFLLLLAHCNHSRDYSTGTVESHVTYAIGSHMTPCSQSFQYFNHMSFSESSVCVQCAQRSITEDCIMVVHPNKMHNMFTRTKVLWPLVETYCWGMACSMLVVNDKGWTTITQSSVPWIALYNCNHCLTLDCRFLGYAHLPQDGILGNIVAWGPKGV